MLKHLGFDIHELQETKLSVRLINSTNERRRVQGHGEHETTLQRVKGDIEDIASEQDNMVTLKKGVQEILMRGPIRTGYAIGSGPPQSP
ncbi:hypothetical protein TNCV_276971 [Trichonephila clavipes]|uniref:Uncharacterized protein n=1 Tax=Trichonephila clavipes TaxID=2585209 RepID=A0A8X6S9E7_TRICX|nr:hypothetical protein TNCV_276971 [Trichonephila clavipes]